MNFSIKILVSYKYKKNILEREVNQKEIYTRVYESRSFFKA